MMTVTPFNSVLDRMVSLTRAMDQSMHQQNPMTNVRAWTPAIDASETEAAYVVTFDLPGIKPDQVDVNFERNTLTVKGERTQETTGGDNARVFFTEREWGAFERSLRFPQHVEGDKISADFANGVLTVTVPKSEGAKPRKILVK